MDDPETNNAYVFKGASGCYIREGDISGGFIGYIVPNIKDREMIEITVNFSDNGPTPVEARKHLDEILSTFKFTK